MPSIITIVHGSPVAREVIEHLNECKRAWRETPDGKQWYWLVPADLEPPSGA